MNDSRPTDEVTIAAFGGVRLKGALAIPEGEGPHPGMVVLHEAFGLNDDIRRITGRFAANGYVALAPDLYSYGNRALCLTRVMLQSSTWSEKGALAHIEAARRHLADRPDVDSDRIGVVGFCMGGAFALAMATKGRVGASAVNYGGVPKNRRRLQGACPIVASYGGQDRLLASHAGRLEEHLEALGVPHDVKLYPEAGHSFLSIDNQPAWMARLPFPNALHPGYNADAAEDAWGRMLSFFDAHLSRAKR